MSTGYGTPESMVGRKVPLIAPAEMDPQQKVQHFRVMVRADVMRVAKSVGLPVGEAPSEAQYHQYGRYGIPRVFKALGRTDRKWSKAMEVLMLGHSRNHRRVTEEQVVADMFRVARLLRRPNDMPTPREYAEHGAYSPSLAIKRLVEGGYAWQDVARYCGLRWRYGSEYPITTQGLLDLYGALSRQRGCKAGGFGVGQRVWEAESGYSGNLPRIRFGSWNAFVQAAGYQVRAAKRPGVKYHPDAQKYARTAA